MSILTTSSSRLPEQEAARDELCNSIMRLRLSDDYSDLTIACGPHTFHAHKAVLCPRSKYFEQLCRNKIFKEARDNAITLKATTDAEGATDVAADDPEAVKLMMDYFYHLDYCLAPTDQNLTMHCKLYALATKYEVVGLQNAVMTKLRRQRRYGDTYTPRDYVDSLHVVYNSIPDDAQDLRTIIFSTLLDRDIDVVHSEAFEAAIRNNADLACDIIRAIPETPLVGLNSEDYGYDNHTVAPCTRCGRRMLSSKGRDHNPTHRFKCSPVAQKHRKTQLSAKK